MASIAASVGLGNVLRFPGLCAKFGGGAFLLVYAVAMFALGVPFLCTEIALGRKTRSSAPQTFKSLWAKGEFIGWAASANSLVSVVFYAAIIGWIATMAVGILPLSASSQSLSQEQISGWFFSEVMKSNSNSFYISPALVLFTVIGWVVMYLCIKGGASSLSKISKYTLVIPVAMLALMAVRGLLYSNSGQALKQLFQPDFSALANAELWITALGQAFFSLSVLAGVMPTYGSFMPDGTPVFKSALTVAAADLAISVLAAVVFFTAAYGAGLTEYLQPSGIASAFSVYPVAIISFFPDCPVISGIFGIVFYLSLLLIALQSTLSLAEAGIAAIKDKFKITHKKAVLSVFIPASVLSLAFCTESGAQFLEICDTFANRYNVLILGVLECIALLIYGNYGEICTLINGNCGKVRLPYKAYKFSVKILCPTVFVFLSAACIVTSVFLPKNSYPAWAQIVFGYAVVLFVFLSGFLAELPNRIVTVGNTKRKKRLTIRD